MRIPSLVAVAALSAASSLNPTIVKGEEPDALCPRGNATLSGTYMSMGGGTEVGVGPIAFVGKSTYDGNGNFVNPFTMSVNGVISTGVAKGTYTVNGDCTGLLYASNGVVTSHFVINPDGSKVDFIRVVDGFVVSSSQSRMKGRD